MNRLAPFMMLPALAVDGFCSVRLPPIEAMSSAAHAQEAPFHFGICVEAQLAGSPGTHWRLLPSVPSTLPAAAPLAGDSLDCVTALFEIWIVPMVPLRLPAGNVAVLMVPVS